MLLPSLGCVRNWLLLFDQDQLLFNNLRIQLLASSLCGPTNTLAATFYPSIYQKTCNKFLRRYGLKDSDISAGSFNLSKQSRIAEVLPKPVLCSQENNSKSNTDAFKYLEMLQSIGTQVSAKMKVWNYDPCSHLAFIDKCSATFFPFCDVSSVHMQN